MSQFALPTFVPPVKITYLPLLISFSLPGNTAAFPGNPVLVVIYLFLLYFVVAALWFAVMAQCSACLTILKVRNLVKKKKIFFYFLRDFCSHFFCETWCYEGAWLGDSPLHSDQCEGNLGLRVPLAPDTFVYMIHMYHFLIKTRRKNYYITATSILLRALSRILRGFVNICSASVSHQEIILTLIQKTGKLTVRLSRRLTPDDKSSLHQLNNTAREHT